MDKKKDIIAVGPVETGKETYAKILIDPAPEHVNDYDAELGPGTTNFKKVSIIGGIGEAAESREMRREAQKIIEKMNEFGTKEKYTEDGVLIYEPEPYVESEMMRRDRIKRQNHYNKYLAERENKRKKAIKDAELKKNKKKIQNKSKKQNRKKKKKKRK